MWGSAIGAGIQAVGSLAGGLLNNSAAKADRKAQQRMLEQQIAYQREFAQNGIRWKVDDGKAAGLHPLAAIGAQGASYTPVTSSMPSQDYSFLGDIGQQIGGAIANKKTPHERTLQKLQIEAGLLDKEAKLADIEHVKMQTQKVLHDMKSKPAMPVVSRSTGSVRQGQNSVKPLMYIEALNRDGSTQVIPNPDLSLGDSDFLFPFYNSIDQIGQHLKRNLRSKMSNKQKNIHYSRMK